MTRIIKIFIVALLSLAPLRAAEPVTILFGGDLFSADFILTAGGGTSITSDVILSFLESIPSNFVPGVTLPPPTPFVSTYPLPPGSAHIDAGDYLVLYYGDAAQLLGGAEVLFFPTATDNFTVPLFFPPGTQELSLDFALLYDHAPAPDGGLTLALLGLSFAGVTFARRAMAKRQ